VLNSRALVCCLVFFMVLRPVVASSGPMVASINLCADQLILLLAQPDQITTLSNLSHDQAGSYYYQKARAYPVNESHAEQILPLQPDLVIAGQYSNVHTVNLLREVGLRVEILAIATNLVGVFENIRSVATWLEKPKLAEAIIAKLEQRLDALGPPTIPTSLAAVYDPNGFTVGGNTLRGEMMQRAGWANVASKVGITDYGHLSLESMIRLAPDALIESPYSQGTYSRGQALSLHPALRQAGLNPKIVTVPSRMTICAGPWTIDVIEQLHSERLALEHEKQ